MARGFLHSHSYTGNAFACRAALAVLDIFEQDDVIAANRVKSAQLSRRCRRSIEHPRVSAVPQYRHDLGIRCCDEAIRCSRVSSTAAALERGLLLRPLGNTVYFMPPYIIEEEHMDMLVEGTCAILDGMA